jgi:hypothetical protein
MRFLYSFLCLVLLSCDILAIPVQPRPEADLLGRSFKVDRVRRSDYVADGTAALQKAYAKFGIIPTGIDFSALDFEPLPPGSSRGAAKATELDENGAVGNLPFQNDVEFLSPVNIGGQEFVMNFDTGSSDT